MRKVLFVATLTVSLSCGSSNEPAGPSPTPTPTQTLTFSGTVSETAPTTSKRIAGATVTVMNGSNPGKSATTDASGAFQVGAPVGQVTIRTRAANYVERVQEFTLTESGLSVAIELDPVFQTVTTTTDLSIDGGDACPGWWDGFTPDDPCKADHIVNVHHNGTLMAQMTWSHSNVEPFMQLYTVINGRPSELIAESEDGSIQMLRAEVAAHTQYLIQVRMFSTGGGPPQEGTKSFRLTTARPN